MVIIGRIMKFLKHWKYLLILIVIALIAVSIVLIIKNKGTGKEKDIVETLAEEYNDTMDKEVKEQEGSCLKESGYYVSSSDLFQNYFFKCPDGWVLLEKDNGSRVLIKNDNNSDGNSLESVFFIVERLSNPRTGLSPEDIINNYMDIANDPGMEVEILEEESFYIEDNRKMEIAGYKYNSALSPYTKEIDLISYIQNGNYIYLIKYMGSNIEENKAKETFKNIISTFSFNDKLKAVKKADKNTSINILILGLDSGMGRDWSSNNARSDINIILHINLETCKGTMVTIPRDLWVSIPGHNDGKINGAYTMGGIELAIQTFEDFTGLDIDNYIITDFDGFIPLIDFLGGVTVEINENLADSFSGCYLNKGVHLLNGEQALALCRNRHRSGDGTTQSGAWAREKESAKVILGLIEQKSTLEKIIMLPAFINYLVKYTWTDLSFGDILKILPVVGKLDSINVSIKGVPSYSKMIGKASAVVHYEEETAQLFEEIKNQ